MNDIVILTGSDLDEFLGLIQDARSVRVAIEGGGVKVSVNNGMWTLPMGRTLDNDQQPCDLWLTGKDGTR